VWRRADIIGGQASSGVAQFNGVARRRRGVADGGRLAAIGGLVV